MRMFHFCNRMLNNRYGGYSFIIVAENLESAWDEFNKCTTNDEQQLSWSVKEIDLTKTGFYDDI